VINGLTKSSHPCQIMADILTFEEHCGPIQGRKIAWSGDGNNVLSSWMEASALFGFALHIATPESLSPPSTTIEWARHHGAKLHIGHDPVAAVEQADAVITDCWVSMGDEDEGRRHNLLQPYQVNSALMNKAAQDAIFMHCLPAHRGEEVTDEVMDGPQSVVFDEAENRLHAQKGILAWCLG
jgi:ornithine carbamoyltransferase